MIWVDCLYNPVVYLYSLFFRPEGEQDVREGWGAGIFFIHFIGAGKTQYRRYHEHGRASASQFCIQSFKACKSKHNERLGRGEFKNTRVGT